MPGALGAESGSARACTVCARPAPCARPAHVCACPALSAPCWALGVVAPCPPRSPPGRTTRVQLDRGSAWPPGTSGLPTLTSGEGEWLVGAGKGGQAGGRGLWLCAHRPYLACAQQQGLRSNAIQVMCGHLGPRQGARVGSRSRELASSWVTPGNRGLYEGHSICDQGWEDGTKSPGSEGLKTDPGSV